MSAPVLSNILVKLARWPVRSKERTLCFPGLIDEGDGVIGRESRHL